MTKTELKQVAQDQLMNAMQVAFSYVHDNEEEGIERDILIAEMDKQMSRVEKLFGYEPGSFTRGG